MSQLAVKGLLPPDSMERPLPLTGASGDRLKGVEIDLIVKVDGLPETRERFFVGKFKVVAGCFLAALIFAPVIAVVPPQVTAVELDARAGFRERP